MKKETLVKMTKYILDFMYYGGMIVTASLPISVKVLGKYYNHSYQVHYWGMVVLYFVLGIAAGAIIWELRRIFQTVLDKQCFVRQNVDSLNKMSKWSLLIVVMTVVRTFVFLTPAMLVVMLVFIIAGLFSKVLAFVFEEAIEYKEENDFTI